MADTRTQLIRGAAGTFLLKVTATGLSFFISLILARLLKAEGFGVYSYAMAWVFILSIPSILGLESLLVREVSVYFSRSQWSLLKGLIRYSRSAVSVSSLFILLCALLIALFVVRSGTSLKLEAFMIAMFVLPLRAISAIHRSILKGLQRVVLAQVPEMLIQPLLFLSFIVFSYFFIKKEFYPTHVIALNIFSSAIATILLFYLLNRHLPEKVKVVRPEYRIRMWFRSGFALLLITGMGFINSRTDIIMLGAMKEAKIVGIYSVASAGADLVSFVLFSVNTSFGPILSRLYQSGERQALQREITHSARLAFLFSLPLALILVVFGKWFLLLYGEEFTAGATVLSILCIGQIINVSAGSVGLILIMTGHEKETSIGFGLGALVNILLNFLLIPKWSKEGAAVATAISIAIWNITMAWFVWKRLGLYTTAFGDIRKIKIWWTNL